jgi:hypothetical protein
MTSFSGPRSKRLKGDDDGDVSQRCLIVVLENCSLESAKVLFVKNTRLNNSSYKKHSLLSSPSSRFALSPPACSRFPRALQVGKTYEILSSDKHAGFLRKQKKDPSAYRPDILHQAGPAPIKFPGFIF